MGIGVREQRLVGLEALVLARVRETHAVDLVELEPQEVELALAGARVAAQALEHGGGRSHRGASRLEIGEIDRREPIEGPPLAGGGEEPDVGVLSVQVDEGSGQLGQLRGGDQLAIAVGARTTVAGHHAREDDLVVGAHEASLDDGLVGARAHHRRIGAIPGQEPDGADRASSCRRPSRP